VYSVTLESSLVIHTSIYFNINTGEHVSHVSAFATRETVAALMTLFAVVSAVGASINSCDVLSTTPHAVSLERR